MSGLCHWGLRVLGLWVGLWKSNLGFVLTFVLYSKSESECDSWLSYVEGLMFLGIFVFLLCLFLDRVSGVVLSLGLGFYRGFQSEGGGEGLGC